MSKPWSRRTWALRSSTALHHTNSSMSGWSTSRITILAARRVLPPDLIVPAEASAPRMKLTGPDAVPPPDSLDARADVREVGAGAGPTLEDDPLLAVPLEDRVHRVVDPEDEARRRLLRNPRDADVEPHRAVERRPLRDEHVLQLGGERGALGVVGEVAALGAPAGDRVDHPVDRPGAATTRGRAVPSVPRKYFWATMLLAFSDQSAGNSTAGCSNATVPASALVMRASRRSHTTSSYGSTPGDVKSRPTPMRADGSATESGRAMHRSGSLVLHLLPASPVACVSGGLAGVPEETTSL